MAALSQPVTAPSPAAASDRDARTPAERDLDPAMEKLLALREDMRASEARFRERFRETLEPHIKAEFINGEIILDSPARMEHTDSLGLLFQMVSLHVNLTNAGKVQFEKALVTLDRDDVEPDLCFWAADRAEGFRPEQYKFPPPDWAVEILSPSSEGRDRGEKFRAYEAAGVREYWLVDAHLRRLEPYLLDRGRYVAGERLGDERDLVTPACLPELSFPLAAMFDRDANVEAIRNLLARS